MTAPTRADLLALLADVEAYLAQHVDVVDIEGGDGDGPQPTGPNEAMRLSVDVSRMREELETEKDAPATDCALCLASVATKFKESGEPYHVVQKVAPPAGPDLFYNTYEPCTRSWSVR